MIVAMLAVAGVAWPACNGAAPYVPPPPDKLCDSEPVRFAGVEGVIFSSECFGNAGGWTPTEADAARFEEGISVVGPELTSAYPGLFPDRYDLQSCARQYWGLRGVQRTLTVIVICDPLDGWEKAPLLWVEMLASDGFFPVTMNMDSGEYFLPGRSDGIAPDLPSRGP